MSLLGAEATHSPMAKSFALHAGHDSHCSSQLVKTQSGKRAVIAVQNSAQESMLPTPLLVEVVFVDVPPLLVVPAPPAPSSSSSSSPVLSPQLNIVAEAIPSTRAERSLRDMMNPPKKCGAGAYHRPLGADALMRPSRSIERAHPGRSLVLRLRTSDGVAIMRLVPARLTIEVELIHRGPG